MYVDINGNKWYKGNLHTHTTRSDGRLKPEETIELYKNNGYDFITLTDHWVVSETINGDILQISGCEYDTGNDVVDGIYHIVAIGIGSDINLNRTDIRPPAQDIIDAVNNNGGYAILAHPVWSMNTPCDIKKLKGLAACEIFNSVSDLPRNLRGDSGVIVDRLAAENYLLSCVAADDAHFYDFDQCRSFVWVKAEELTQDAIINSLRNGDFIASQNPFFTYTVNGDTIEVDCTPVKAVAFMTNTVYTADRMTMGENITHASYKIKPSDTYVRIELIGHDGEHAWSSPFKVR